MALQETTQKLSAAEAQIDHKNSVIEMITAMTNCSLSKEKKANEKLRKELEMEKERATIQLETTMPYCPSLDQKMEEMAQQIQILRIENSRRFDNLEKQTSIESTEELNNLKLEKTNLESKIRKMDQKINKLEEEIGESKINEAQTLKAHKGKINSLKKFIEFQKASMEEDLEKIQILKKEGVAGHDALKQKNKEIEELNKHLEKAMIKIQNTSDLGLFY